MTTKSLAKDLNIFDILVEKRKIGYILLDVAMNVQFINQQMALVLNLVPKEVENKCWYSVLPSMSRYKELYDSVLAGSDQDLVMFEMDFPEGRRYWEVDHLATNDENGNIDGLLIVAQEVTVRQRMSIELSDQLVELTKSNEKLNRSKKAYVNLLEDIREQKNHQVHLREDLEVKTHRLRKSNIELAQFAYIASHDLQEPLRTISNFSELLKKECDLESNSEAQLYLEFISEASDRMSNLIGGLLDYSRLGIKAQKIKLNFNAVLDKIIQKQVKSWPELSLSFNVEKLPELVVFPEEIEILFTELVTNAIKFRKAETECKIHIYSESLEDGWKFYVADNGIGIDMKFKQKVFLIYKRLHAREKYPGTGIGLSQCKKIVELHGGTISVDSEVGKGSCLYFTIPNRI